MTDSGSSLVSTFPHFPPPLTHEDDAVTSVDRGHTSIPALKLGTDAQRKDIARIHTVSQAAKGASGGESAGRIRSFSADLSISVSFRIGAHRHPLLLV